MSSQTIAWITAWLSARRPGESITVTGETDLYRTGLLDSLGIIELIEAMEDEFGLQFTEDEMQAGLTRVADFERVLESR